MSIAVNKIITESKVSEFKWSKLRNARYYLCAKKILDLIIQDMFKLGLRVDTIVWDTHDSRHRIIGRDDMANYERMFFIYLGFNEKAAKGVFGIFDQMLGTV